MRLKGFGAVGEPVTLAQSTGIRTWGEFGLKLCLWRFTFLNYTKLTQYEALEKNAVSRQQIAEFGTLKYSLAFEKAQLY